MSNDRGAPLRGISSMATRLVLGELVAAYTARTGQAVDIESVGGVDAAKRVEAGEAFDVVLLAADAVDKLIASGRALAPRRDLVRSGVAVAVRAGAPHPRIDTEAALREAVAAACSLSLSTGPSGVQLAKLFERWGLADAVKTKLVQAPPGVPVGSLVAKGEVELGFQQLSELMHLPGIDVLGPLPDAVQIVTTFSAAACATTTRAADVGALLDFLAAPETAPTKQKHGMQPA